MSMGWMAAAGIVSDILDSALSEVASRQKATKAFHRQKMVMKNMIQWRVKDLQKAGLNPMLATGAGVGGQSAMVQQAGRGGEGEGPGAAEMASAANVVFGSKKLNPEIDNIVANTGYQNKQADVASAQKDLIGVQKQVEEQRRDYLQPSESDRNWAAADNSRAQAEAAAASAKNMDIRSRIMELGIPGLMNQFGVDSSKAGEILNWINNITNSAEGVTRIIKPFTGNSPTSESPRVRGFE